MKEQTTDYIIRKAEPEDVPAILKLLEQSLGSNPIPRTPELWSWKHEKNLFGTSPCLLAEANGTLVGLRAFLPWRWSYSGDEVRAVRAVDTVTHSQWRGRGIFSRLTLQLLEDIKRDGASFVFNTPNKYSRPGYLKMGWQDVGRIPVFIRVLRPLRIATRFLRVNSIDKSGTQPLEGLAAVSDLLEQEGFDDFLTRLYQYEKRFHTCRSKEYLRWRYAEIPGVDYCALWDFQNDSGAVVIARSRARGRLRELTLSEILATPDQKGTNMAAALIGRIAARLNVDYIAACAAPGTMERQILREAGFLPFSIPGPRFMVRPLNSSLAPEPTSWDSWRLSIGDLEVF